MKPITVIRSFFVALLIIAASAPLNSASAVEYARIQDSMVTPSIYEQMPGLWEYLIDETMIEWTELAEAEPNNDKDHAMTVTSGTLLTGSISETSDQNDYFKVVLNGQSSLFTQLTWSGTAWVNLYIYNADMEPQTYLNENTPSPKNLSLWQYNSGTFYVRVKSLGGAANYQLKIGVAGQLNESQNDALLTTDMVISAYKVPVITVNNASADPVDFFSVFIPDGCESATISLDWLGSTGSNLDFEVWGSWGGKIQTVNQSTTFESTYSQNVPSDTYYIAVKAVTGSAMYQLTVDSEVDLKIEIPHFEFEQIPVWGPPFPWFDGFDLLDEVVLY